MQDEIISLGVMDTQEKERLIKEKLQTKDKISSKFIKDGDVFVLKEDYIDIVAFDSNGNDIVFGVRSKYLKKMFVKSYFSKLFYKQFHF